MSLRTVARRYAGALFDVARRKGTLDAAAGQLRDFQALVKGHLELARVFDTPAVGAQKKRAILEAVLHAAPGVDGEVGQLLRMLADRDRLALLPEIVSAFGERMRQEQRVLEAEITTAVPLPDAQRSALVAALRRATGSDLSVTERVEPAIIGGVVARVGSLVFDGSVTGQLDRLKQRLLQET